MKKSLTIIAILILMLAFAFVGEAVAAATTVSVADSSGANGDRVKVPINVVGASNLAAMDISLTYDSSVLKGIEADSGALATNALVESNEIEAGRMLISFADTRGISGDGAILEVTFEVAGGFGASTQMGMEAVGYDVDLLDVPLETASGTFRVVEKGKAGTPVPGFEVVFAIVGLLAVAYLLRRKK